MFTLLFLVTFLVDSRIFSLPQNLEAGPGAHRPPIQWVPVTLSLDLRRHGREADLSPPLPHTPSWRARGELYRLCLPYVTSCKFCVGNFDIY
jgi:hypothetical protein